MATKDDEFREGAELSYNAVVNRMKDIGDEIRRVANKEDLNTEDEKYLTELEGEFDQLSGKQSELQRQALVARVDAATGRPSNSSRATREMPDFDTDPFNEPGSIEDRGFDGKNPWNLSEVRTWNRSQSEVAEELRARAFSAIEKAPATNDKVREAWTGIVEKWDNERGDLSRSLLLTSSPAYMRAFVKAAKGRPNTFTQEEADAVDRAMSLTDTAGGFLIPQQLDPTVIITSDGSLNEIRQAARQVVATGDVWNGVSAGETSWGWATEATQVTDDASTFAQPAITIHRGEGFVPISIEALQDEANVANEVARLLAAGKDTLEADAFATGSGTGQPFGIVTALNGAAPPVVAATTNDAFGSPDVYLLDESLPARYRGNASWLANRAIYNDIRQFDSSGGAQLWERIGADVPALLLGRPAFEAEGMDGAIATGDDYVLVYGDFSNYVIADRIGTTVEFITNVPGANGRPTGQKGWFAYFRVGADSVNDNAFKLLRV